MEAVTPLTERVGLVSVGHGASASGSRAGSVRKRRRPRPRTRDRGAKGTRPPNEPGYARCALATQPPSCGEAPAGRAVLAQALCDRQRGSVVRVALNGLGVARSGVPDAIPATLICGYPGPGPFVVCHGPMVSRADPPCQGGGWGATCPRAFSQVRRGGGQWGHRGHPFLLTHPLYNYSLFSLRPGVIHAPPAPTAPATLLTSINTGGTVSCVNCPGGHPVDSSGLRLLPCGGR